MKNSTHYQHLSQKWKVRHESLQSRLWEKHKESLEWFSRNYRKLVAGSLGGLMLLSSPNAHELSSLSNAHAQNSIQKIDKRVFLISDLSGILPNEVRVLTNSEEEKISDVLSRTFGFEINAELEGKRLNRNYGLIGAEQHLSRYPGDTLATHFDTEEEIKSYWQSGMAPGLGAWRYFTSSREALTDLDKDREKYYIAVQTFLSKDFHKRFAEYRNFYKYRKMLVVNPNNGLAIVADIADAGPSEWTGKHLGGSPEVMRYLERYDGALKGPVLYFFIDDPNDKIPLGPVRPI